MTTCRIWYDGEENEPADFPEAPVVGDIIYDQEMAEPTYFKVTSRQWDLKPLTPPILHIHAEHAGL